MRLLISNMILPLPVLCILIVISLILYLRRKKSSQIALIISLLWFFAISTPLIPDLLIKSLENRYNALSIETLQKLKDPVNILVLGNGHTDDEKLPPNSQLSEIALTRLCEGIRIHRLIPGSTIITSGYGGSNEVPNAVVSAQTAILLGVDSVNIKKQSNPQNTWQEALTYKQTYRNTSNLILVTSAAHMPRSMFLFRKTGLNPVAAPTDFMVKHGKKQPTFYWMPSPGHIEKMESAIHEYIGFLWYKLGGS